MSHHDRPERDGFAAGVSPGAFRCFLASDQRVEGRPETRFDYRPGEVVISDFSGRTMAGLHPRR
ncbi:MAG: hypothetical protein OXE86_07905 [Alphaproteobacteria bacterium]|nr:hypothetical protein [Alphaproteobacteria bacterium]